MDVVAVDPTGQAGNEFMQQLGATVIEPTDKKRLNSLDMCVSFSLHAGRAEISRLFPRRVPLSISLDLKDCGSPTQSGDDEGVSMQPWVQYALDKVFEGSFFVIYRHRLACTVVRGSNSPMARHPIEPEFAAGVSSQSAPAAPATSIANDIASKLPPGFSPAIDLSESGWGRAVWRAPVLHDVLVHRAPSPTTVYALLHIGGQSLASVVSDGMCLATPSGSSGYARTVGAAAVDAGMEAVQLCPINPNSLAFRPMVLPGSVTMAFTF